MTNSLSNVINYCRIINGSKGFNDTKTQFINEITQDYNTAREDVIYRFDVLINSIDAKEVYINGSIIPIKGVIDIKKKQTADTETEETIQVYPNQIKQGDYIKFKVNETDTLRVYLIKSKIEKKYGYDEGVFKECNGIIKWLDNNLINQVDCIITNQTKYTLGISTPNNGMIVEGDSRYEITMSYNEITKNIKTGQRFIFNSNAWKVTQIDYTSEQGLLSILLGQDNINENDNLELEIADYYTHNYSISLNSNSESIQVGGTYQVNPIVTDKGVIVNNLTITYSSSDETIAKVDSNGIVTAISVGSCNITASSGGVSATLLLTVTAKTVTPVISYGYTWSNGTSLKTYVSSTINLTKTIDSMSNPLIATYSLDSIGTTLLNSGAISITKKSDSSYQIKNVNVATVKSFAITFTDSTDSTIIMSQTINLSGM